jgi:DNA invertase Pin-like site-specific DNA recombinase
MSKGKTLGYIRVSTSDQNPERQLQGIQIDKTFIEYASGSRLDREQLALMMDYIRDDDLIVVHSIDRLARNVRHLLQLIEQVVKKGAKIRFIKENLEFSNDNSLTSKLLLTVIGAIAEFELCMIKERQKEGIELAKKAGKYKGRQPILTDELKDKIHEEMKTRKPLRYIAEDIGVSRDTVYNYLKKLKKENNPLVEYYNPRSPESLTKEHIELPKPL